jgi:hypothetical protein
MELKPGNFCPLIKKDCMGMACSWFTQMRGTNPNTGKEIDEWGCAITWLPVLMVENSQQQKQTGAAVESFRNEMVKANANSQEVLIKAAQLSNQLLIKQVDE